MPIASEILFPQNKGFFFGSEREAYNQFEIFPTDGFQKIPFSAWFHSLYYSSPFAHYELHVDKHQYPLKMLYKRLAVPTEESKIEYVLMMLEK